MSDPPFDELFREVILDHYRRPRNRGSLAQATCHAEGMNPVCGDEVRLDLRVDNGLIEDVSFDGQGCSISQSSASMMTEGVKGRPLADAEALQQQFRAMMLGRAAPGPELGDLEALQGVTKFPIRIKCALLPWNVLREGLAQAARST